MTDNTLDPQTSNGEVRIGKYDYPVLNGSVSVNNQARFQGKLTFGDYSFDSDPLISSRIYSHYTGGQGNEEEKAGVDDDTFWTATLETRYPDGPTLLPLSESFTSELNNKNIATPLGDYPASSPDFYAVFDQSIQMWDKNTRSFVQKATLAHPIVERGVEFEGLLYIPMASNGYVTMNPSYSIVASTDVKPIHFLVFDNKLFALETDGTLRIKTVGVAFAAADPNLRLPSGQLPRKLAPFINQRADPCLYIVTNKTMYAYDPDNAKFYQTKLKYPNHPNQGLAASNWRGDSLYVSVGLGIHGYNGSLVTAMGPDSRYGLPAHLRGTIVDLVDEYNAMLAFVKGVPIDGDGSETPEGWDFNPPMWQDANQWAINDYQYRPTYSSILRWANSQWHKVWESDDASGIPTLGYVSEADGEYRLWWGYGDSMWTQELPITFQNPKQSLRSQASRFALRGEIITGWFNADMLAFEKLGSHIEINLEDVTGNNQSGGAVAVYYEVDNDGDDDWKSLGFAYMIGRTVFPFNPQPMQDGSSFSYGQPFERIRFKIAMQRPDFVESDQFLSPLVSSMVFKFIKIPYEQLSWSFNVPLMGQHGFKGVGNKELRDYLNELLVSREFVQFNFKDNIYRAYVAGLSESAQTGYEDKSAIQVNILGVRVPENRHKNG
jgi:hypothetical protein